MKNLKVSAKLLAGFGIAVLFTLTAGILGVVELGKLSRDLDYAVDQHGRPLMDGGRMLEGIHVLRTELRTAILFRENPEKLQTERALAEAWTQRFEKSAADYSPYIVSPEAKALFGDAMDAYEKRFKPALFAVLERAEKGAPFAELVSLMASEAKPSSDLVANNLKKTMELKAGLLDAAKADGAATYRHGLSLVLAVVLTSAALSVFLGLYISKLISKPLGDTVDMITEMGQGNLSRRLNMERADEIGVMAKTMDAFAENLQNVVLGAMKRIAGGDLNMEIEPKGTKDEISATLAKMVDSLNVVVGAMKRISEGDLSSKIEPKSDKDEVSHALKNTVASLNAVVGAMKKIADGDLSSDIRPKSDRDEISAALKKTVESLRELIIDDGGQVLAAAAGKDLSQRLTGVYKGEFARMKDNINTVMQSLDAALTQVTESVSQVAGASGEISDGAQSLAEGSNEQASSLEEVSSSLEEMSSMIKQNADNSNQAMILASEASAAARDGDVTIRRMANAINQIKQSSDNTAKIVKSIDDIAFQTNLLALNAAVEAARAGEAGKGFAVVAEEVRNLAMRSAEAAQNTADMIEESVKNADGGVKITEEVAVSLGQIVNRTCKVGDLIAEIAAASKEQAQGIEQVNVAVAQMNRVTQRNAANSEESAGAAEELNNQAAELANMVGAFKLSGSNERRTPEPARPAADQRRPAQPKRQPAPHHGAKTADRQKQKLLSRPLQIKTVRAVDAKELIPLEEEEYDLNFVI